MVLPCQWPPPLSLLDPLGTEPQDWLPTLTAPLSPLSQLMFWLPALTTWPLTVKLQKTRPQDTSHAQRKITNDPIQVSKGRAKKISIAKGLPFDHFLSCGQGRHFFHQRHINHTPYKTQIVISILQ